MRAALYWALVALAVVSGCEESPAPADAASDGAVDAGYDAGTDAGPAYARYCSPCLRHEDCGEGNLCLYLEGGARGCGLPCETDADCDGLPVEATCDEEVPGMPLACDPVENICVVSAPGSACTPGSCTGTYDRCLDSYGFGPVCTVDCRIDADCPLGLRRCRDTADGRVCVPDEIAAPERCRGLLDHGRATACEDDDSCPGGGRCFGHGSLRLCLADAVSGGCDAGHLAWPAPDGSTVCVPHAENPDAFIGALAPDCHCVLDDPGSMLDEALSTIGRDRCSMTFPSAAFAGFIPALSHDRFRLSWTDRAHAYWPASLSLGRTVAEDLDAATAGDRAASRALTEASRWADLPFEPEEIAPSESLAAALEALVTAGGGTASPTEIAAEVAALPSELADRLIPVVDALAQAVLGRERALRSVPEAERELLFTDLNDMAIGRGFRADYGRNDLQAYLLGDLDLGRMALDAIRLTDAIEAASVSDFADTDSTLSVETGAGRFAIRGSADDTYGRDEWEDTLFLLELGGDDTYLGSAGATSSVEHGVSVLIDVAGSDTYSYPEVPVASDSGPAGHRRLASDGEGRDATIERTRSVTSRQGAGRLGIGLLFDLGATRDEYRSLRMSQGYGALGVGLLYDRAGDDLYHGEAGVQGAGNFGLGLLIDGAGNDEYVAYHAGQGFAYVKAVGVLYDRDGDDVYDGVPDDPLYPSSQDDRYNASFLQGAGFGRRADFIPDGVFMSGGLGVLRDRAGVDRYRAGIFAQATGFWYGAGLLLEGDGDDVYEGVWYVQSGDAHFAISVLLDDGGNDRYNPTSERRNVAIGGGHDFSIAWLVDRAGDDVYLAPGISYGAGNEAGAGIFCDLAGTDTYDATRDNSFGSAAISRPGEDALRRLTGTVGIFLEADGVDTYTRPDLGEVANDASWEQSTHGPEEGERGVGLDRTAGRVGLP